MKAALLDTNVLLALAWPNHQHHVQAHDWFAAQAKKGWATCAFTQLGFVRLSSNPAYTANAVSPPEAATLLQQWTRLKGHHFWSSPAAHDPAIYARALGHQQVNDAWLVEVAPRNSGRLVTLDTRLPVHSLEAGTVEVIKT
ncbi:MAG TPA: PIN domain-containing protein [Verrucomicrobiota bacterium]|nr:VapC toxin family PIN domain ribonuclease [Verrucomicrobiales bacterium]HRI14569.1 PIN domain-containing protein [Verrucomicrobiota bacterium]